MTLLEHALAHAARGFALLPCNWIKANGQCSCDKVNCGSPGKHPLGFIGAARHGWKDASLDPEQVKKWWKRWPKANIGIACGPSGIVIIDIDVEKGGEETWAQIKRDNPTIKDSAIQAITQSGGRHLYYAANPGVSITNGKAERLGAGVDVRGADGIVIAPGSRGPKGEYRWAQ